MTAIVVKELRKEFRVPLFCDGRFYKRAKNYFFPKTKAIAAVDGIDFNIREGERVAFIGPNGAGKSTTIKMLAGIMHPTEGSIEVLGKNPIKHRKTLAYEISAVLGHLSKLWHHLPVEDSYKLLAAIYDIPAEKYQKRLTELVEKFHIAPLLSKLVRQLSLGERMRCEIVASFLHNPKVIFLDEPTIGLDITAKTIIRDLLRSFSKQEGSTLLLTSHDTDDIEMVCDRVIMIDKGKLVLDDSLENLKTRYIQKKVVRVTSEEERITWNQEGVEIKECLPYRLKMEIDLTKSSSEKVMSSLLQKYAIKDFTIEDPSLETVIKSLYAQQVHS